MKTTRKQSHKEYANKKAPTITKPATTKHNHKINNKTTKNSYQPGPIGLVNSGSDWSAVNVFVVTLTSSMIAPLFSSSTTEDVFKLLWVLYFSVSMSAECSSRTSVDLAYSRKLTF